MLVCSAIVRALVGLILRRRDETSIQTKFWTRQGVSLLTAVVLILGLLSIWFNDPTRLTTAFGLVSAGLAFALQQVVTAVAGYFVILRGSTLRSATASRWVGCGATCFGWVSSRRPSWRWVNRPAFRAADPAMWVRSRQFTGRIVTVSNSQIFSEPVFNYTRDFPLIWEEMAIPITYQADRARVEAILLDAARQHAIDPDAMAAEAKCDLQRRFGVEPIELEPRVFYRITDNWLELTVRFIVGTHRIRAVKDAMSRHIITELDKAGIGIASATYDIVGLPPIKFEAVRDLEAARLDCYTDFRKFPDTSVPSA